MSYRSLTVNWTPVFNTSGLCGWVGMQGCRSTTRELHTQTEWVRLGCDWLPTLGISFYREGNLRTWRGCSWGTLGPGSPGCSSSAWWGRNRRWTSVPTPVASSGAGGPAAGSQPRWWTCGRRWRGRGSKMWQSSGAHRWRSQTDETRSRVGSPVLQLIHAGVGRTTDAGNLLPSLPLGQLFRD